MKLVQDVVLVEVVEKETRTESGLYLPSNRENGPTSKGVVKEVGPGKPDKKGRIKPMELRGGEEVVFSDWVGVPVEIEGREHRFMREEHIDGVLV